MSTALLTSLSPVRLNATVCAVKSVGFSPGIISAADRHSGNLYETLVKTSGAEPRLTLNMPFRSAFDVIGLGVLKLTTFEIFLAQFVDYIRSASAVHTKIGLNTSATAVATITGWTVDLDGDLLATVDIIPLAASSGAHPLLKTDNVALATLLSQPVLHTLGPISINGAVVAGLRSAGGELGQNLRTIRSDADRFPRQAGLMSASPRMSARSSDPYTLLNTLGLLGANITANVIQYFRQYDPTTGVVSGDSGTGIAITCASGRIEPAEMSAADADVPEIGLQVTGLSSSSTHPFAVSVAATVPAT